MKVQFFDLERDDNPLNCHGFSSPDQVLTILDELWRSRPPFMCEFVGDQGFTLTVGIGTNAGCVQHSRNDGIPPYLMAIDTDSSDLHVEEMSFLVGGTATPIYGRYSVPIVKLRQVVAEFAKSGNLSTAVNWEEF